MSQKNLLNLVQGTLEKGSILAMEKGSPIVGCMTFQQINGNAYSFNIIDTLLPTNHRELGEEVISDEMQTSKVTRELIILTNSAKVDRALYLMTDITDIKAEAQHLAMVSSGKALEKKVIEALNTFITTAVAGEVFTGVLTTDLIDDALDFVNDANMIFVNNKGHRALKKLLKAEGQAGETIESFGRRVVAYNGIPVHVSNDLADNEILVVNFGEEAVHGITNGGLRVYEKTVGVHDITDTELLYNVVCKTRNSFAKVEFTA
ncbi:MAG: hypothetical protein E7D28_06685 [Clostridium sp.]|nr:hypothetical protein [Clostridium sp.]MDU2459630.1 hypothetical protein [Clostridium sp.]